MAEKEGPPVGRKLCFVIGPIGADGSEDRKRSDQVLKHIVTPAAHDCGYEPLRADKISEPGLITSQIIQHLVDDPMVVADLTSKNPNVFYELAVRHAVRRPLVQIIKAGESIPFDVSVTRAIQFNLSDPDSVAESVEELKRQIKAAELDPGQVDTPISTAIDVQQLRQSGDLIEKSLARVVSQLETLTAGINDVANVVRVHESRLDPAVEYFGARPELMKALIAEARAAQTTKAIEPAPSQTIHPVAGSGRTAAQATAKGQEIEPDLQSLMSELDSISRQIMELAPAKKKKT